MHETGEPVEEESAGVLGALRAIISIPLANAEYRRNDMTLCPIAIAVGCKKCPVFTVCPVKSVIGDYKAPEVADPKPQADETNRDK